MEAVTRPALPAGTMGGEAAQGPVGAEEGEVCLVFVESGLWAHVKRRRQTSDLGVRSESVLRTVWNGVNDTSEDEHTDATGE